MATKKEVELKGETMEKSPVFASEEKELLKKIVLLEYENALLPQLKEEVALLKKELLSVKKSSEEITANEHGIRKLLEKSEHVVVELKEKEKELLAIKKSNEEIIANEHSVRKELEKVQAEIGGNIKIIEEKNKQVAVLKADLTKLANLFDEYIVAYQDQVKMLGVFVKNTQTIEKYLSVKINEFNGGDKK
jgi:septal ring factor EnvC (AmiA/AmiB activator)